jgi:hypothetical protein
MRFVTYEGIGFSLGLESLYGFAGLCIKDSLKFFKTWRSWKLLIKLCGLSFNKFSGLEALFVELFGIAGGFFICAIAGGPQIGEFAVDLGQTGHQAIGEEEREVRMARVGEGGVHGGDDRFPVLLQGVVVDQDPREVLLQ